MIKIAVLGSTGSIGINALKVIEHLGPAYKVVGLVTRANDRLLVKQAARHKPEWVTLFEPSAFERARPYIPKNVTLLPPGIESIMEIASRPEVDIIINSLAGAVGFAPMVAAIKAGKRIALANKEPMVMAGKILMAEAKRWGAEIIPVDSEPSAIFQCLHASGGGNICAADAVSRIFLTASGGPFYRTEKRLLEKVAPEQALAHPNWKMGPKITVDCATLMNKGLEALEIQALFSVPLDKIEVLIHPQSIVHSAVEFCDGSVMAQMSVPDMRLPIQYAVTYPDRKPSPAAKIDFFRLSGKARQYGSGARLSSAGQGQAFGRLDFFKPDTAKFPCLRLALEAGLKGGTYPAVLNAADEIAVEAFLAGKIKFTGIPSAVENVLGLHKCSRAMPSLSEVVEADQWAREKTQSIIGMSRFRQNKVGHKKHRSHKMNNKEIIDTHTKTLRHEGITDKKVIS